MDAEAELRCARDGYMQSKGKDHDDTIRATHNLMKAMSKLGRWMDAEAELRCAKDGHMQSKGSDYNETKKENSLMVSIKAILDQSNPGSSDALLRAIHRLEDFHS